jgi:acyl-CoA reductase-like NAD-dependent aldehyde dehydrogenase
MDQAGEKQNDAKSKADTDPAGHVCVVAPANNPVANILMY